MEDRDNKHKTLTGLSELDKPQKQDCIKYNPETVQYPSVVRREKTSC